MSNSGQVLVILVGAAFVGGIIYFQIKRASFLLEQWAAENQYQLLRVQHRLFRRGPFWWSGKGQVIYRVDVRDEQGHDWLGWVRCGHWLTGLFSDAVEARWDA